MTFLNKYGLVLCILFLVFMLIMFACAPAPEQVNSFKSDPPNVSRYVDSQYNVVCYVGKNNMVCFKGD